MNEDRQYTLEDAIEEERWLVNVYKSLYVACTFKDKQYWEEAEKHRQKAEWLAEYEKLTRCRKEGGANGKRGTV